MALFDHLHAIGNTVIIVTHEPDIAEYAQRIVTLHDGVIASDHPSTRHASGGSKHSHSA
jgi:putative ABC transport system ATP-binding protein